MQVIHNINEEGRKKGCPTGQCCDICNLYRPMYKHGEAGEVTQIWDCQWNNLALLMSEAKNNVTGVQKAVESSRNETVKRQDAFNRLVAAGTQKRLE